MSDYHVLHSNALKTKITVAMHHLVPDENNEAGKALVDCVLEDDFITKETRLPSAHIAQAEIDQIEAGEVFEEVDIFEFDSGMDNAEIRNQMDQNYQDRSIVALETIRDRYAFWGFSRDIP